MKRIYTEKDADTINTVVAERNRRLALYNKIGTGEVMSTNPAQERAYLRDKCYELSVEYTKLRKELGTVDDDDEFGFTALALDPVPFNPTPEL